MKTVLLLIALFIAFAATDMAAEFAPMTIAGDQP